ncbi:Ras-related protein Rab [Acrasis kona]|uniref:Ras-related protein Rab n=1 Tax=Acrasis kona TaxID=1008807 RepID=A0AAW2ZQK4_9EUKA
MGNLCGAEGDYETQNDQSFNDDYPSNVPSSSETGDYDFSIKIVLVGAQGTGKSSIINRFESESFKEQYKKTIGMDFSSRLITLQNGRRIQLQIWDASGALEHDNPERFVYYNNAHGLILAYDITNLKSFKILQQSYDEFLSYTSETGQHTLKMIIGNKIDNDARREVPYHLGEDYAINLGALFYETSCLTGQNVEHAIYSFNAEISNYFSQFVNKYHDR